MIRTVQTVEEISLVKLDSLSVHPAAEKVPRMRAEEWTPFLADVNRHGVVEPIVICGTVILDGRHRYDAAKLRGDTKILSRSVELDEKEQLDFLLKAALLRRHLSDNNRAMLGAEIEHLYIDAAAQRMKAGKRNPVAPGRQGRTVEQAAAAVGSSGRSVSRAKKIKETGTPELIAAVQSDAINLSAAERIADLSGDQQVTALNGHSNGDVDVIAAAPTSPLKQMEKWNAELERWARQVTSCIKSCPNNPLLPDGDAKAIKDLLRNGYRQIRNLKASGPCHQCSGNGCRACRQTGFISVKQGE